MWKYLIVLSALATGLASQQARPDCGLSANEVALRALGDYGRLKIGMTRQDVEKNFTLDGGMNFRGESRYVYSKCEFIQFKVTFDVDPKVENEFSSRDRVSEISELYLQYAAKD